MANCGAAGFANAGTARAAVLRVRDFTKVLLFIGINVEEIYKIYRMNKIIL
jgi:hypothetical protein